MIILFFVFLMFPLVAFSQENTNPVEDIPIREVNEIEEGSFDELVVDSIWSILKGFPLKENENYLFFEVNLEEEFFSWSYHEEDFKPLSLFQACGRHELGKTDLETVAICVVLHARTAKFSRHQDHSTMKLKLGVESGKYYGDDHEMFLKNSEIKKAQNKRQKNEENSDD